ncbi:hypothetical protein BEP19_10685 [Ammoniphilus oxalaticus]|uniref:Gamma-glutamylcyclotransferase family protein n=1 Tax=Ammoniphilus oxalaticus TaxID=66863 RepID=A0A419SG06_9BACL|nr:gamma-glutamylcyclotransferase family protein [Ammoniphilus oxalaticus]RKD22714.1 hypothetical protein BEP19_10685 [Ammoniphilus oxalaticus]
MSKKHYVFVYGTLRTGEPNHHLLHHAQRIVEQCWTQGTLLDVGPFPALIPNRRGRIYGELYLINEQQLQTLDQLEGFHGQGKQNHFERIRQTIHGDRSSLEAWVYVYPNSNKDSYPIIQHGDWKCHRQLATKSEWLYFAYGSCMDDERIRAAGKEHLFQDVVGRGIARGYSFRYTRLSRDGKGRADMVEGSGWVEGKVYRIKLEALRYLYHREGVKAEAYRPAFITARINGEKTTGVLTFLVVDKKRDIEPPIEYVREIVRGGKGFISDRYFQTLKEYHRSVFNMDIESLYDEKDDQ